MKDIGPLSTGRWWGTAAKQACGLALLLAVGTAAGYAGCGGKVELYPHGYGASAGSAGSAGTAGMDAASPQAPCQKGVAPETLQTGLMCLDQDLVVA